MLIEKIELSSFRGLSHKEQVFDKKFNVIIGINGIGKTSVLEAIAVLLTRILPRATPAVSGYRHFIPTDVRSDSPALTARIWLRFGELPLVYGLTEGFGEPNTFTEDKDRKLFGRIADRYEAKNEESRTNVPVALFYTTDRSAFRMPRKSMRAPPHGRAAAYHGALRDKIVNYGSFVDWLRTKQALAPEREDDRRILKAVDSAIKRFLPAFGSPEGTQDPPRLFLKKDGIRLGIEQLSDGERSFLAMVVDISRHLAQANPSSDNPLENGEGVVLIDELELHLHPKWQRTVVEHLQTTFPKIQFITTTHSPFVIQSLESGQLINFDPASFAMEYADKSVEDITENVMGVKMPQKSERYRLMIETAEKYFQKLEQSSPRTTAEVERLRNELDSLTEPFSDDPAYVALLRVERETRFGGIENAPD